MESSKNAARISLIALRVSNVVILVIIQSPLSGGAGRESHRLPRYDKLFVYIFLLFSYVVYYEIARIFRKQVSCLEPALLCH